MPTTLCRAHEAIHSLLCAEARPARTPQSDSRYDELRLEIDRAQEMTGKTTDWPRVLELGRALLGDGHEDLRIAAYTARAAQTVDSLDGFAFGLALFTEFLGPRWATVSPPPTRLRARASALRWWVHAAAQLLQRSQTEPAVATEELTEIATAIDTLREQARAHLNEQTPALGELKREFLRLSERCTAPSNDNTGPDASVAVADLSSAQPMKPKQPDPDPAADDLANNPPTEVKPPVATAAKLTSTSPAAGSCSSDLPRQLKRAGQELIDIASRLRQQNIRDPRAYNVLRHGLWLHLEALPPATEGKSQIPPRPPSISRQLKALEMRTAWAELIDLGERLLARHRLDLDLQRTTATALLSLDPPAEAAADAIRTRTVELLRRFPGLLDLRSSDGAALADSDTRAWLRAEHNMCNPSARHSILPNSEHAHTSESASEHSHRSDSRHNSIQTDSHNSALKGDASQNQGQSGLFIDRLQLAERALLNGNTTFAAALFAGLETMVDLYQLDRWRPDLAERVLLGTLRTQASTATVSSREKRLGSICPQALADFLRTAAKSS